MFIHFTEDAVRNLAYWNTFKQLAADMPERYTIRRVEETEPQFKNGYVSYQLLDNHAMVMQIDMEYPEHSDLEIDSQTGLDFRKGYEDGRD